MKLIVESIGNTAKNKEGFKNLMIRREVLESEKSIGVGRRMSILGNSLFEKKGRVAFFVMSDKDIKEYDVKVGMDINTSKLREKYGEMAIQVIETTDRDQWEEEIRLSFNEKINPTTEEPILNKGKQIWQTAILTQIKYFNEDGGDITLKADKL